MDNTRLFNALRNVSTPTFQSRIPALDSYNIQNIAQQITSGEFTPEYNEFLSKLIDRIGLTLFRDNMLHNRLAKYRVGSMEYGRYIQELAFNIVKGQDFVPPNNKAGYPSGTNDPFTMSVPDVKQLMYEVNSRRMYQTTINQDLIKRAFTDPAGLSSLISAIISQLSKSAEIDDWVSTKELFNKFINSDGSKQLSLKDTQTIEVAGVDTADNAKSTITTIKQVVSDMGFPRDCYNEAGILQMSRPEDLVLFIRQDALNFIDTNVLAFAFNRRDLSFTPNDAEGAVDIEPMDDFGGLQWHNGKGTDSSDGTGFGGGAELYFGYDNVTGAVDTSKTYTSKTGVGGDNDQLSQAPIVGDRGYQDPNKDVIAVLLDKRKLMIVNNNLRQEQIWNPRGLYTNMFLHNWNLFAMSGALNGVVFKTSSASV